MGNFNIKRFGRTARWQLGMSYKSVLSFASGASFAYIVPYIGWTYPYLKGAEEVDPARLTHSVEMCTVIFMIIAVICGSFIFADMGTKKGRIAVKMLPATDLEKFLVRFLAVTLGVAVVGIAAFCVADVVRILVCLLAGIDYVKFCLPDFLLLLFTSADQPGTSMSSGSEFPWGVNFVAVCWCVWAHSLYVLGGTLLRRYQLVAVSVVHLVLFLAFAMLLSFVSANVDAAVNDAGNNASFAAAGVVLLAVAVANWMLSYRIFRRMQVADNKWINL